MTKTDAAAPLTVVAAPKPRHRGRAVAIVGLLLGAVGAGAAVAGSRFTKSFELEEAVADHQFESE